MTKDPYLEALEELDALAVQSAQEEAAFKERWREDVLRRLRGDIRRLEENLSHAQKGFELALRQGIDRLFIKHLDTSDEMKSAVRSWEQMRDTIMRGTQDRLKLKFDSRERIDIGERVNTYELRMEPWVFRYMNNVPLRPF